MNVLHSHASLSLSGLHFFIMQFLLFVQFCSVRWIACEFVILVVQRQCENADIAACFFCIFSVVSVNSTAVVCRWLMTSHVVHSFISPVLFVPLLSTLQQSSCASSLHTSPIWNQTLGVAVLSFQQDSWTQWTTVPSAALALVRIKHCEGPAVLITITIKTVHLVPSPPSLIPSPPPEIHLYCLGTTLSSPNGVWGKAPTNSAFGAS